MNANDVFLQQFLIEANNGNKKSTETTDRRVISKFLRVVDKPVNEITKEDILLYIRSLDIAETTRDLYKITIRRFFTWMQKPELVCWIKVNRLKNYNYKTESDILTSKEVELLIQHCQSIQEQAMVAVLYDYVKNTNKNFLKFTNKSRREIGLNRIQLNKAVNRLVEYGVLEFYRGKNIRFNYVVREKM
jgi:hypothetical protein